MDRARKIIFQVILIAALAALIASCSTANQDSPLSFVNADGKHPSGWIAAHGQYAEPDGSLCVDCHGDDLAGGITGVSCSADSFNGQSCHGNGPAFHPADWLNKNATAVTWHALAYQTGLQIGGLDCVDCHTPPALDDPVDGKCLECHFTLSGSKTPGGWTHGTNSPISHSAWAGSPEEIVCVTCHEINNSFGYAPFCHNCHGSGGTHPDPDWDTRALHGVAAKQAPGNMAGFSTCATCHGNDYNGDGSAPTCLSVSSCHQVDAPHPSGSRWQTSTTPSHRSTNQNNAPACALCHRRNSGTAGCFNNTLCHGNDD